MLGWVGSLRKWVGSCWFQHIGPMAISALAYYEGAKITRFSISESAYQHSRHSVSVCVVVSVLFEFLTLSELYQVTHRGSVAIGPGNISNSNNKV